MAVKVSCVAIMHGHKLLIGKRSDDGKWNLPGGHHEDGEKPDEACSRELEEETGIHVDPDDLIFLGARKVEKKSGKKVKVYAFKYEVDKPKEVKSHDSDEEHDWQWVDTANGLPKDVIKHWHNEDDVVLHYIGLMGRPEAVEKAYDLDYEDVEWLAKAFPKKYHRVKGQDASLGTSSERQKHFMQAVAAGKVSGHAPTKAQAEEYVENSGKSGKGKKVKKSSELFYAKIEGLLEKGFPDEALLSNLMDAEVILRDQGDDGALDNLYSVSDRLFDSTLSKEEQVVYELAYLAKGGDEDAREELDNFLDAMSEEFTKHVTVEDLVADMVKSNYGPKQIGGEKVSLYNNKDNVGRKSRRTGEVQENAGQNKAAWKYTPSVHGTFAQQANREAKRDKAKSKKNPVKVYTEEEKRALQAQYESAKKGADESNDPKIKRTLDNPEYTPKEHAEKSADNSKVKGKVNGHSYRMVHGYKRYTSGPKRGQYVHRDEAEKRLGRKLSSKEHVDHTDGKRGGTKNTKVMSAGEHSAKTNKTRANGKGYTGSHRYEHTGSH